LRENGISDAPWPCDRYGHDWVDGDGIAGRRCCHCPAVGFTCPHCDDVGMIGGENCSRCHATGTVEVVEISAAEVERLKLTSRRFAWLLTEFCYLSDATRAGLLEEIDALIGMGASQGKIRGRSVADMAKASRAKKPSAGNNPVNAPDQSSIAENPEKS
jgi:hypothetical protein